MLKEVNWSEDRSYRTGSESEPIQFYMEGLSNSKRFDLLLGYFSSAAINVLSLGFASFLYNGGTVRMVVNNILSQADKDAIKAGREGDVQNTLIDLSDIKQLKRTLDDYGKHFFDCLAWLIANDKIQIKIIRPKSGRGIAHYKSGAFSDGTDTVGFKSSCNFTAFGLLENLEELDANLSWEGMSSLKKVARQNKDFEEIFSGKSDIVEYLDADEITVAIKKEFGNSSLNELLIKENELAERKSRVLENKGVRRSFENAIIQIEEISRQPKFPYKDGPRGYQKMAFENWKNNNQQGLFAMATGTGKTITSLNCLLEIYKKTGYYKALILVPTITLVNQWENE
ncbi:MAG: DEAD/DEAH box helicase family protein, partial [Verrucomicrobia bacterium]|nr:DEAD/DEAH box helicase family protein [Verrucomicrobiota bacterium]